MMMMIIHVAQIVNTEQLQRYIPYKRGLFQVYNCKYPHKGGRVKTECDDTSAETRFGLPAKRTSPFISAGVSVQSSTGFLGVWVGGERL